jgi:hypothetical protein
MPRRAANQKIYCNCLPANFFAVLYLVTKTTP